MTYKPTDRFENWFITSLQTDINDTTTSFRLNKALNVHQGRLVIDPYDETRREIVKVTSVDGNLVYVERGDDNTAPEYHNEGTIVAMHVFAADMNDLYADWAETDATLTTLAEDAQEIVGEAAATQADAIAATQAANTAASSASSAASTASTAANAANSAASSANSAANSATNAATDANNAAGSASSAAQDAVDAAEAALNAAGHFVPAGGLATQALVKASDSDYDLEWGEGGGGASVTISDTPPEDAEPGDLWGDTSDSSLNSIVVAVGSMLFPIGQSIITNNPANPATYYGFGTWVEDVKGRTIVGVDSTQTEFDTVGETGGAKTHTLTTAQIPNFTGSVGLHGGEGGSGFHSGTGTFRNAIQDVRSGYRAPNSTGSGSQSMYGTLNFNLGGGGQSHNNLQPYITKYIWTRTA